MAGHEPSNVNQRAGFPLLKQLGRLWRLIGTGLSFVVFGMSGLFISIFIFPLIFIFVRDPETRRVVARKLVSRAFAAFVSLMKLLGALSFEVTGMENAGTGNNRLIIANHPTLIDVVFLVALFPMVDCVIKEAVIKNPFMHGVVTSARYISSDDPGQLLDSCVNNLKSGASLLLFPEGTRSVQGQPLAFKPGAASIAVRSGATILPVTIRCSQPRFLAKHEPWYRVPPERPFFMLKIHSPMELETLIPKGLHMRKATHVLNSALLSFFENELG